MLNGQIIGNLGNDAELQYAASGQPRLRFKVAANQRAKNEQNEWVDKTEWVRCTLFGNRAESLAPMLKKGTKVYVGGRLEARPWSSRDGSPMPGLEIVASDVELMSPRQQQQDDGWTTAPPRTVNASAQAAGSQSGGQDDDEQLPF